jgi:hypothetical protein
MIVSGIRARRKQKAARHTIKHGGEKKKKTQREEGCNIVQDRINEYDHRPRD